MVSQDDVKKVSQGLFLGKSDSGKVYVKGKSVQSKSPSLLKSLSNNSSSICLYYKNEMIYRHILCMYCNIILAWNLALKCDKRPGLMKDLFILCSQVSAGLHIVTGNNCHV